jgi:hypothetical protein
VELPPLMQSAAVVVLRLDVVVLLVVGLELGLGRERRHHHRRRIVEAS